MPPNGFDRPRHPVAPESPPASAAGFLTGPAGQMTPSFERLRADVESEIDTLVDAASHNQRAGR